VDPGNSDAIKPMASTGQTHRRSACRNDNWRTELPRSTGEPAELPALRSSSFGSPYTVLSQRFQRSVTRREARFFGHLIVRRGRSPLPLRTG
jgi:hypothetical protein